MPPVSRAPRRYFIEFNAAMVLYVGTVVLRGELAPKIADLVTRDMLLISPIIPVLLAAIAVVRFYRGLDEYHRLQVLESLAIAAGVAGVAATSWTFLEDLGLPHLSIAYTWPLIAVTWGVAALYLGWKDEVSAGTGWKALRCAASTLLYVGIGIGVYALIAHLTGISTHWAVLALVATVLFIARMGFFLFAKPKAC